MRAAPLALATWVLTTQKNSHGIFLWRAVCSKIGIKSKWSCFNKTTTVTYFWGCQSCAQPKNITLLCIWFRISLFWTHCAINSCTLNSLTEGFLIFLQWIFNSFEHMNVESNLSHLWSHDMLYSMYRNM